jgi:hypothetical protein
VETTTGLEVWKESRSVACTGIGITDRPACKPVAISTELHRTLGCTFQLVHIASIFAVNVPLF